MFFFFFLFVLFAVGKNLVVDVDAPGHEDHVHTWWDLVFDESLLSSHLSALQSGAKTHPSASVLAELFLSHRRRQIEAGQIANAALLLQCAVRVAAAMKWGLEEIESSLETEQARALLREIGGTTAANYNDKDWKKNGSEHWANRFEVRRYSGAADETGRVLQLVQELQHVPEATDECCRALFLAGNIEQAHARATPDSMWWRLTQGNVLLPPTIGRKERPHKRVALATEGHDQKTEVLDEMELEKKVQNALKRGEIDEAKETAAILYEHLRATEAKRASLKYK